MKNFLTLIFCIVISSSLKAQIPNGDFENWDSTSGYKVPVGWDNMNAATSTESVFTCLQTSGYSGTFGLRLVSKSISGMGVVPGIAVCGKYDQSTHQPVSGFPFASRPQVLAGEWQYMAYASDQGFISVLLTKWNMATNSRDTIENTVYGLPGMVMFWTPFKINLNYLSSAIPDSAIIMLSSSGASVAPVADNSFLFADDLRLTDSATLSVNDFPHHHYADCSIFPNPAKDQFTLLYNNTSGTEAKVYINDMNGRTVRSLSLAVVNGRNELSINTSGIGKGMYFIKIIDDKATEERKILIE